MNRKAYPTLLGILRNSTKLGIVFLLLRNNRMTVTQISEKLGVSKAYLYGFVRQLVKDGVLLQPESEVKRNYVEKYYRLNWKIFASTDQKSQLKGMRPSEQKEVLQSFLAALGLHFRLFAEEVDRSGPEIYPRLQQSVRDDKVLMSYLVVPDIVYEKAVREVRRVIEDI